MTAPVIEPIHPDMESLIATKGNAARMIAPDTDTSAATTTETLLDVATEAITLLRLADETVGVAESLTAGGVMAAITNVPGASSAFRGGVVSYATELKQSLLNVDPALIQREGVIHGDVAAQMAEGARTVTSFPDSKPTTWGIGTTGVAGPAMQDGKPVGMVFIGIASVGQETCAWGPFMFPGDREAIRQATVKTALGLLRDQLKVRLEDGERKNVN